MQEFRPGGYDERQPDDDGARGTPAVTVLSTGNPLPAPVVVGTGGRIPPDTVIEDDATGDVETSGVFDPDQDGLDFYESLEGMRVQLNNAVAVGPTEPGFGETPVVGDDGANASVRTYRGGIAAHARTTATRSGSRSTTCSQPLPNVNVGDHYSGPIVGIMDYNFGNPFIEVTHRRADARSTTASPARRPIRSRAGELAVSTFNFENLAPTDPPVEVRRRSRA